MPTDDQNPDPTPDGEDAVDDLARRAGAELRRPAPEDGLAGVHRSHRRRRTATAAGAAAALVVIAGGTIVLANRGGDDDVVVTEDPTTTTVVETTEPAPSTVPEATAGSEIEGTWWLIDIDGERIVPGANTIGVPEVIIGDGDLFAYFGCNSGAAIDPVFDDGRLVARGGLEITQQLCSIPDDAERMVLSERVLVSMLDRGADWVVDGDTMTWTGDGSVAIFTRDEDELPSALPTLPATLPIDPTTTVADVDASGTWWLTEIDGSAMELGVDAILQPFLIVDGDRMEGSLGCSEIVVTDVVAAGDRLLVDATSVFVDPFNPDGVRDETDCNAVPSQEAMSIVVYGSPTVSIVGETMTWSADGRTITFTESIDGSVPATTVPVTTTTVAVTTTTVAPEPVGFAVSDEALPDAEDFGSDGFLRELVDRSIVVRSNPDVVIPIDVPDDELRFLGVGPDNVAYVSTINGPDAANGFGPNRLLAVPTAGPNAGTILELFPLQEIEGPWGFTMGRDGIDHLDLGDDVVPIPFVDSNGQEVDGPDSTFTWMLGFENTQQPPFDEIVVLTERSTGRSFEAPLLAVGSEGNRPRAIRPLPDGRLVVGFEIRTDSLDRVDFLAVFAFDPATGSWTRHPWS